MSAIGQACVACSADGWPALCEPCEVGYQSYVALFRPKKVRSTVTFVAFRRTVRGILKAAAASGCRQKGQQESYWTKGQDKTSPGESSRKLHFGETCLPLLRERRLGPQLHQAARSPVSQVLQQALWIGSNYQEGESQEGQEVDLRQPRPRAGLSREARPLSIYE
jgi:hypothetical protein